MTLKIHQIAAMIVEPLIQGAACYGMVEITRGCGRGCAFCTPTMRKRHYVPIETIVEEVKLNVSQGADMAFLATEDLFLYGCKSKFVPDKHRLKKMLTSVAAVPGLKYIQASHAALAPIVYDKSVLEEITPVMMENTRWGPHYKKSYKQKFITVEVGVETGEVFSAARIDDAREALVQAGVFSSIEVTETPVESAATPTVDLDVQLSEGDMQRLKFGVGFATEQGRQQAEVTARYEHRNLFGGLRRLQWANRFGWAFDVW